MRRLPRSTKSIYVLDDLWASVRRAAKREKQSVSTIVEELLEEALNARKKP